MHRLLTDQSIYALNITHVLTGLLNVTLNLIGLIYVNTGAPVKLLTGQFGHAPSFKKNEKLSSQDRTSTGSDTQKPEYSDWSPSFNSNIRKGNTRI